MRGYGIVLPQFWIGATGRELRKDADAMLVAAYLITSPHANMLGLYYLPMIYIAHETGRGIEGASKGLQRCIEAGFCSYDEATETVWVPGMAKIQIADTLKPADKRVPNIQKQYESLHTNPFLLDFFDRYGAAFHLVERPDSKGLRRGIEGASKPPRSQEQEQEQDQEQDQEQEQEQAPPAPVSTSSGSEPEHPPGVVALIAAAPAEWPTPTADEATELAALGEVDPALWAECCEYTRAHARGSPWPYVARRAGDPARRRRAELARQGDATRAARAPPESPPVDPRRERIETLGAQHGLGAPGALLDSLVSLDEAEPFDEQLAEYVRKHPTATWRAFLGAEKRRREHEAAEAYARLGDMFGGGTAEGEGLFDA